MATLSISITIPDDKQTEIVDNLAAFFGWTGVGGETKLARIKVGTMQYLKDSYIAKKQGVAVKTAYDTAVSDASSVVFS